MPRQPVENGICRWCNYRYYSHLAIETASIATALIILQEASDDQSIRYYDQRRCYHP